MASTLSALVGLVGFGGLFPANRGATCEASDLLGSLRDEGFRLHLDSAGGLVVQPASALTNDHRQAIRDHRAALVDLLGGEAARNFGDDRRRCTDCRHLRSDHRCAEAMRGRLDGVVDRNMHPMRHNLQRCPNFKALEDPTSGPEATA